MGDTVDTAPLGFFLHYVLKRFLIKFETAFLPKNFTLKDLYVTFTTLAVSLYNMWIFIQFICPISINYLYNKEEIGIRIPLKKKK
ncbi:hypothetical protein MSBR3_2033 [Methanosarcina barkeri 3]|uniref:Uncharacterized protein n=1 Tax=Methanosarcina barkeri 3 TaxID=1434107 RepID=A0A0E3SL12_METBA|nr:hypothetical protein MSBR3_2033 [Methanosarcina barkeri 3]